jgi:methionyl-tRNA formyltransferase
VGTIAFAGTAAFAVPALDRLCADGHRIPAVVTQPDRPSGRGHNVHAPPVKQRALELKLPVHQPATLKDDAAREYFAKLGLDLIVVVAYGKIIPAWLISLPRFGVLNLHGSLLPKYRGAAPIQWAMANGEAETGVSTMKIDAGLDTGPVYLSGTTPIGPEETVEELTARLAAMGSELLSRTVTGVLMGTLDPVPQDNAKASYAPLLTKADGFLDWRLTAWELHNRIRAFQPWPGAVTRFRESSCKILRARVAKASNDALAGGTEGTLRTDGGRRTIEVICGEGSVLEILELQFPGRKPWTAMEFMNGMQPQPDEKFHPVTDN